MLSFEKVTESYHSHTLKSLTIIKHKYANAKEGKETKS